MAFVYIDKCCICPPSVHRESTDSLICLSLTARSLCDIRWCARPSKSTHANKEQWSLHATNAGTLHSKCFAESPVT